MACCADCAYMDLNDSNSYGDYWCGYYKKYYPGGDSACSNFKDGNRDSNGGGCYITTVMVDILGYEDHCTYLEQLRNFRDSFMKSNTNCKDLLNEYDSIGPIISEKIQKDSERKVISKYLFENYINKSIEALKKHDNWNAIEIYKSMVNFLKSRYDIDKSN